MVYSYGFSYTGKSHIARNIECQDAHRIEELRNGWWVAAVADGVGSATNSAKGSKIAVNTVVEFCKLFLPYDYNEDGILAMLKTAYYHAFKMIIKESVKTDEPIESFDTTLHTVIYDGKRIYYGHSGDGGIIGLNIFGEFVSVTKPQKDTDGIAVIPLRAGSQTWEFGTYSEDLASVLLVTDGMLETICNYLLKENGRDNVYIPLGSFFADPAGFQCDIEGNKQIVEEIGNFVNSPGDYDSSLFYKRLQEIYRKHISDSEKCDSVIQRLKQNDYPVSLMKREQDDKTIVCLINYDEKVDDHEAEYYDEVDWATLRDKLDRALYPHLYNDHQENEKTSDSEPSSSSENLKETSINALAHEENNGSPVCQTKALATPDTSDTIRDEEAQQHKPEATLESTERQEFNVPTHLLVTVNKKRHSLLEDAIHKVFKSKTVGSINSEPKKER